MSLYQEQNYRIVTDVYPQPVKITMNDETRLKEIEVLIYRIYDVIYDKINLKLRIRFRKTPTDPFKIIYDGILPTGRLFRIESFLNTSRNRSEYYSYFQMQAAIYLAESNSMKLTYFYAFNPSAP